MKLNLLTLLFLPGLWHTHQSKITKTQPEIIFQPIGSMIAELSFATLRIKMNLTELFEETTNLCNTQYLLHDKFDKYYKITKQNRYLERDHIWKNSETQNKLIINQINELSKVCHENSYLIDDMAGVFNVEMKQRSEGTPPRLQNTQQINDGIKRKRRQILIGLATGIISSLVSIFSTAELMHRTTSEDTVNDLVDNSNNIITTLQSHETRLEKTEAEIKTLKTHLSNLDREIFTTMKQSNFFFDLYAANSYATTSTNHLHRIEDGLYKLLDGKLSPNLVSLRQIKKGLKKLQQHTSNRGYTMSILRENDIYQCQTSFVSYPQGNFYALVHIPIYRTNSLLKLYECKAIPLMFNNDTHAQIMIEPNQNN